MATPEAELKKGLASLFKSEEFSDFIITCGPHAFKVHKAVLSSQSEYFRVACRRDRFKESETNTIDLKTSDSDPTCDDPEAVKCMVHFFYHLDHEAEKLEAGQAVDGSTASITEPAPATSVTAADTGLDMACGTPAIVGGGELGADYRPSKLKKTKK